MFKIKVESKDYDLLGFKKILDSEVKTSAMELMLMMKREAMLNAPTATGMMRNSIDFELLESANEIVLNLFSPLPYAAYVNSGTKPHFPPIQPIRDWVKIKIGIPLGRKNSRVAFMIAKKIAKRGTRPQPFFAKAYDYGNKNINQVIQKAIERAREKMKNGQS